MLFQQKVQNLLKLTEHSSWLSQTRFLVICYWSTWCHTIYLSDSTVAFKHTSDCVSLTTSAFHRLLLAIQCLGPRGTSVSTFHVLSYTYVQNVMLIAVKLLIPCMLDPDGPSYMDYIITEQNVKIGWSPPLRSFYEYYILYCEPNCGLAKDHTEYSQSKDEIVIEKTARRVNLQLEWFTDYVLTLTIIQDDLESVEAQTVNFSIGK